VPGGTFKTSNQGRPWLHLSDVAVPPLVVDPAEPNIVYAGAAGGIVKSTSGGRRWTKQLDSSCLGFARIALDPRQPAHVFASAYITDIHCYLEICTFFRSQDGGATWECLGNILSNLYGDALVGVDPFTSAVYVQIFGSLMRSTDDGATWTSLPMSIGAAPFAASPLVEGTLWVGRGAVSRSRDGGQTWQSFSAGLPSDDPVTALTPDPVEPATLYAATRQSGVFKSTDAGETWSLAGLWPPGVLYRGGLLVDPGEPAIVYAGTEGLGVLRLDQGGR
jgi:hypothetical protein